MFSLARIGVFSAGAFVCSVFALEATSPGIEYRGKELKLKELKLKELTIKGPRPANVSWRVLARHSVRIGLYDYPVAENLDIAARTLNETTFARGKKFSLNGALGPRVPERGYKKARAYGPAGKSVEEFGGGVCMVSTVLYNVFLKAGLGILERHPHSRPVSYAPPGLDAAIYWKSMDLFAKNTLGVPVLLRMFRDGKTLTAELLVPVEWKQKEKIVIRREVARAVIPGKHRDGFRVLTYRLYYLRGLLTRKEILAEDVFQPIDHISKDEN